MTRPTRRTDRRCAQCAADHTFDPERRPGSGEEGAG